MVTLGAAKWGSCANICVGVKVEEYLEWNFHGLPLSVVLIASRGLRTYLYVIEYDTSKRFP